VIPARPATLLDVTDVAPFSRASEHAAATLAAARWRFYSSVRARPRYGAPEVKLRHRPKITHAA
jgi:hypothetical protein